MTTRLGRIPYHQGEVLIVPMCTWSVLNISYYYSLFFFRCVRFTMHQQRRSHFNDLEYSRLIKDRSKWCVKREDTLSNLPQVPGLSGLTQVLPKKPVTRPLSSAVNRNIQHQTSRLQVRAKSAHPRLLHSHKCVHTNVSTQQLEVCKLFIRKWIGRRSFINL